MGIMRQITRNLKDREFEKNIYTQTSIVTSQTDKKVKGEPPGRREGVSAEDTG